MPQRRKFRPTKLIPPQSEDRCEGRTGFLALSRCIEILSYETVGTGVLDFLLLALGISPCKLFPLFGLDLPILGVQFFRAFVGAESRFQLTSQFLLLLLILR
jgi:hypothetical protein